MDKNSEIKYLKWQIDYIENVTPKMPENYPPELIDKTYLPQLKLKLEQLDNG